MDIDTALASLDDLEMERLTTAFEDGSSLLIKVEGTEFFIGVHVPEKPDLEFIEKETFWSVCQLKGAI